MPTKSFVSFQLNRQLFGIDIDLVREINRHLDTTPVPHAPDYVRGLINLRGQIITVLDLKRRLGLAYSENTDSAHNIILKSDSELGHHSEENTEDDERIPLTSSDKASFWVDEIGDVLTLDSEEIDAPPANIGTLDGKYLSGVVKLDKTLMGILSVSKILNERLD